jgi:hypothetical protein
MIKVRGEKREKNVCFLIENVGFPFDCQAKMWLVDRVTKSHV